MKFIFLLFNILMFMFLMLFTQKHITYMPKTAVDTLKNDTLDIDTVSIKLLTAQEKYDKKKKEHRTAYMWGDNKKPVTINPLGGIAININKLFSSFSKIGKRSRRLQRVFKREYEIETTEALWKPLTVKLTNLKGDSLFYFQMYFLPEPGFLEESSYYQKVEYVVKCMRVYRDSSAIIHQRMRLPSYEQIKNSFN